MKKGLYMVMVICLSMLLNAGCSNTAMTSYVIKNDKKDASLNEITNVYELYEIWESEGYPDDIGGLYSVDGSTENVAILIVDPSQERIEELRKNIGDDVPLITCKYSHNELTQIKTDITNNEYETEDKIYGIGVGWSSGGFGENGNEFRVVVVVDEMNTTGLVHCFQKNTAIRFL